MEVETKSVSFKNNYIFLTLFMFLFFGFLVSFFPEENVGKWIVINCSLAILAAFLNFIIWKFQKHDSIRYFSLHCFIMLLLLSYYAMSPIFKTLYPSRNFWILLAVTLGFALFFFLNQKIISRAIIHPRIFWLKKILIAYFLGVACIFFLLSRYYIITDRSPFIVYIWMFYLLAIGFLLVLPTFLTTTEMAKKIKEIPID